VLGVFGEFCTTAGTGAAVGAGDTRGGITGTCTSTCTSIITEWTGSQGERGRRLP